LTRIEPADTHLKLHAPFACPDFTLRLAAAPAATPRIRSGDTVRPIREVSAPLHLETDTWCRAGGNVTICFDLPKGSSRLELA